MTKINTVIFSYDRAMQLDYLFKSIGKFDRNFFLDISVIYRCSSTDFQNGYDILIKKYSHISWYKESDSECLLGVNFSVNFIRNYLWLIKQGILHLNTSNFRSLLIKVISDKPYKNVMFLTDDSVFYCDIFLNKKILDKIAEKPHSTSYSLRHGANISGGIFRRIDNYIFFKSQCLHSNPDWSYPFSVDGHIYDVKLLKRIFSIIYFNSPNTLEANVAFYSVKNSLFKNSYANNKSCLLGFELNKVQNVYNNNNLNISNKKLNIFYLLGYRLDIVYSLAAKHLFRPIVSRVNLINRAKKLNIYDEK